MHLLRFPNGKVFRIDEDGLDNLMFLDRDHRVRVERERVIVEFIFADFQVICPPGIHSEDLQQYEVLA